MSVAIRAGPDLRKGNSEIRTEMERCCLTAIHSRFGLFVQGVGSKLNTRIWAVNGMRAQKDEGVVA